MTRIKQNQGFDWKDILTILSFIVGVVAFWVGFVQAGMSIKNPINLLGALIAFGISYVCACYIAGKNPLQPFKKKTQ